MWGRMTGLTIGEVARRAGLRPSALRYYERAGLLPAPQRINGRRRYDPGVLQRLAAIRLAQQAGFTLAQIRLLLDGVDRETAPSARWRALAPGKIADLEALIARHNAATDGTMVVHAEYLEVVATRR